MKTEFDAVINNLNEMNLNPTTKETFYSDYIYDASDFMDERGELFDYYLLDDDRGY